MNANNIRSTTVLLDNKSVIKCRQELHHEGDNAFYVDKVTFTGSEISLCCLYLHGLHKLRCSSVSWELKEPYVAGCLQQVGRLIENCHAGLNTESAHKSEAMISHGRQEWYKWKANSTPIHLHSHMHTAACLVEWGNLRNTNSYNQCSPIISTQSIPSHWPGHHFQRLRKSCRACTGAPFQYEHSMSVPHTWVSKELIPKNLNQGVITSKPSGYFMQQTNQIPYIRCKIWRFLAMICLYVVRNWEINW